MANISPTLPQKIQFGICLRVLKPSQKCVIYVLSARSWAELLEYSCP